MCKCSMCKDSSAENYNSVVNGNNYCDGCFEVFKFNVDDSCLELADLEYIEKLEGDNFSVFYSLIHDENDSDYAEFYDSDMRYLMTTHTKKEFEKFIGIKFARTFIHSIKNCALDFIEEDPVELYTAAFNSESDEVTPQEAVSELNKGGYFHRIGEVYFTVL